MLNLKSYVVLAPLRWCLVSNTSCWRHGSLEGVGGLKTNEAYHSKAEALVIPEMYFFFC